MRKALLFMLAEQKAVKQIEIKGTHLVCVICRSINIHLKLQCAAFFSTSAVVREVYFYAYLNCYIVLSSYNI